MRLDKKNTESYFRKMRKLILGLTLLAIAGTTTFLACKKEQAIVNSNSNNNRVITCPFTYSSFTDSVGYYHTKGLEAAYTHLYTNITTGTLDSSKYYDVIASLKGGMQGFYGTVYHQGQPINPDSANKYLNTSLDNNLTDLAFIFSSSNPTPRLWTPAVDANIPSVVQPFLTTLSGFIMDSTKTIAQSISDIENLMTTVECSNLNDENKAIVLSGCSVAISSLQYWNNNIDAWANIFGHTFPVYGGTYKVTDSDKNKDKNRSNAVRTVAATDVAATVGAAVTVGITCLFTPVTALVGFGSIIASGIGGSVGAAVYEAIKPKP